MTFGTPQRASWLTNGVHFMQVSKWFGSQQLRVDADDLRRRLRTGARNREPATRAGRAHYPRRRTW